MLNFLRAKSALISSPSLTTQISILSTDIHSHLLPGIDDGVKTFEEATEVIKALIKFGYKKIVTTPHVMEDFYPNTSQTILEKLCKLKEHLVNEGIFIEIEAAAEYYLDEYFIKKLESQEPLLNFGEPRYLLFETGFTNYPYYFDEAIFMMQAQGYTPVLAHPERYVYLFDKFELLEQWFERGILFQINLNSLAGYYSKSSQQIVEKLINNRMVHWAGTDCHGSRHIEALRSVFKTSYFQKLLELPLLNSSLL